MKCDFRENNNALKIQTREKKRMQIQIFDFFAMDTWNKLKKVSSPLCLQSPSDSESGNCVQSSAVSMRL